MRVWRLILLVFALLLSDVIAYAQNRNNLIAAKDEFILLIDLRSSKAEMDTILKRAGMPGLSASKIQKGDFYHIYKEGWKMIQNNGKVVQFKKPITINHDNAPSKPFLITTDLIKTEGIPGYPGEVSYGVNKFSRVTVDELPSGITRFFLPGNTDARKVMLSGSFNTWSLTKTSMLKTDSGWISDVKLQPGIYAYKFIVNGRWMSDKYNLLHEEDGYNGTNSIYYRYNYTFQLAGYNNAKKVSVAGSFNKWNANEIPLVKNGKSWRAEIYLNDGMFTYRFMVDGNWITDPANTKKVTDEKGVATSVINLGETINFSLKGYADAKKVCVAGSFNGWKPNQLFLKRVNNEWVLPVTMAAGNYQYKFIADNKWITDPSNNCYAVSDGITNSFISVGANHTFRLKGYNNAQTVRIAGDFNNWDPEQYTMGRKGDEWVISMRFKPGKHHYKYIVDGNWIIDPGNKLWEPNQQGTNNSIIWVDK
ncbi:hypothetical protein GCM10023149_09790 [Mucilaginibacter gynuensis]|uniref:AMP-activated protein kinase glycogen-binding domain-containing protein n=1 Tax=Mucilaginibacter gynuensis TaxID=1302236 RepID=A0ABP8FYV9_9SPHI